jgi:hypothetical protein
MYYDTLLRQQLYTTKRTNDQLQVKTLEKLKGEKKECFAMFYLANALLRRLTVYTV